MDSPEPQTEPGASSSVPRQHSEAFPVVPKALQQRRADAQHRPFRSSPLSGKSPTSGSSGENAMKKAAMAAVRTMEDDEEEAGDEEGGGEEEEEESSGKEEAKVTKSVTKKQQVDDQRAKLSVSSFDQSQSKESLPPRPPKSIFSASSSSDEAKQQRTSRSLAKDASSLPTANTSTPVNENDHISRLHAQLDAKMAALIGVEKKLLETEQNAKRLLSVLRTKFEDDIPSKRKALKDTEKQLRALMDKMDVIAARSVQFRDQEVDRQTTELVSKYLAQAETLLESMELAVERMQAKERSSRRAIVRTLIVSAISVLIAFVALIVTVLVIVPPRADRGLSEVEDADVEQGWIWLVRPVHDFLWSVKESLAALRASAVIASSSSSQSATT